MSVGFDQRATRSAEHQSEQTELYDDHGRVEDALRRGAPRVVIAPAEVPADVRRARAGAEALAKRSAGGDRGD